MMSVEALRFDHALAYRLIQPGSRVLDLGCGRGELLKALESKGVTGYGIDRDFARVLDATGKGVSVLQMDIDAGLHGFRDQSFDTVILCRTLPVVREPLGALNEALRIGRDVLVSFPNFAFGGVINSLLDTGRMPVTDDLPYGWHNTPNIHLFTVNDFLDCMRGAGVRVLAGYLRTSEGVVEYSEGESANAREAFFSISASETVPAS